jgi:4-hydroxybenzoate polyprenyltransferase
MDPKGVTGEFLWVVGADGARRTPRLSEDDLARPPARVGETATMLVPLLRATHLGPSVVVTAMVVGLAAASGVGGGTLLLVGGAILSGQFSIGWANDWVDRHDDAAAGRSGKPIVAGAVAARTVGVAAGSALAACAVLSIALGPGPAAAHLLAVGLGWSYDLGLKRTVLSPLPYAGAFGLLPVVVASVAGGRAPPWLVAGAALLASGAHFANTLPDTEHDARTGVRGLPQRIGPRASAVVAALLLGAGAGVAAGGRGLDGLGGVGLTALLTCAALVVGVLIVGLRHATRAAFTLAMGAAGAVVVLLGGAGPLLR